MDFMSDGADVATMLTGLSVVATACVWLWKQRRISNEKKTAAEARHRGGFISPDNSASWHVRLADGTDLRAGRIVIDVLGQADGSPDPQMALGLQSVIERDGQLCSVPTRAEYEYLKYLRGEYGNGKGVLIR